MCEWFLQLFFFVAQDVVIQSEEIQKQRRRHSIFVSTLLAAFSLYTWLYSSISTFLYYYKVGSSYLYNDIMNLWITYDERSFISFDFVCEVVSFLFFVWQENGNFIALLALTISLFLSPSLCLVLYFLFREQNFRIQDTQSTHQKTKNE
jgi:hypothetical protein